MTDVATFCDDCGQDIAYGVTCYAPPTGETIDGLPVIRVVCAPCYGAPEVPAGTHVRKAIREEDIPRPPT